MVQQDRLDSLQEGGKYRVVSPSVAVTGQRIAAARNYMVKRCLVTFALVAAELTSGIRNVAADLPEIRSHDRVVSRVQDKGHNTAAGAKDQVVP